MSVKRPSVKRVLVVTDNLHLLKEFKGVVSELKLKRTSFTYHFSSINKKFAQDFKKNKNFKPIDLEKEYDSVIKKFDLIISLHSKKIFPDVLVTSMRCINIHPGYNPYTRGWYPQIFAIIKNLPLGATIHEMDAKLDHGPIIDRVRVPLYAWDTSLSAYNRVCGAEIALIKKNLKKIITGMYRAISMPAGGTIHYQHDFHRLRQISLSQRGTFGEHINLLRALSHGDYKNAYFIDPTTKKKVYLKLDLYPDAE